MAAWTSSYQKTDYGNFNKYLRDKIKSAADMAAEERKYAKDKAEQQRKEGVPEEEIKKHDKGYFFGKALSHEFGGDLFRRTKGTFSKDPSDTEDPGLTKRQRFSSLVRGDVLTPEPVKQLELPLQGEDKNAVQVEDKTLKSWLSHVFNGFQKSNEDVTKRINTLSVGEQQDSEVENKSLGSISKIFNVVQDLKNFFNKNNKLKEKENDLEEKQLELQFDAQNNTEMSVRESSLESGQDVASVSGYEDPYGSNNEGKDDRSMMDKVMDFITGDDLDIGFDGGRRKRGGRRRGPKRVGSRRRLARRKFGGFGAGFRGRGRGLGGKLTSVLGMMPDIKMSEGGIVSPIPMSEGGIVPSPSPVESKEKLIPKQSSPQKQTKLAAGGIVDNPTRTTLGQNGPTAVVPLNRNNPMKKMFTQMNINNRMSGGPIDRTGQGKGMAKPLGDALQLPTMAAGGLLISTMAGVLKNLGGVAQFVKPFFDQMMGPVARVFGLPANILGSVFGGAPAQAATLDSKEFAKFLKGDGKGGGRSGGGGSGGGGTTPATTPSGTISSAPSGKETGIMSLTGGTPTELAQGSTVSNTGLHHGKENMRGGLRVRDYFIGKGSGPSDGRDGLGAKLYTPLGFGPVKYKSRGPYGIDFMDPRTNQRVGTYLHVDNAQHQLDGQTVQPGTFVGLQGGLPGSPSALGSSSAVHLHVEGSDAFHNAVISTYAGGNILKMQGGQTAGHQQIANGNTPAAVGTRSNQPAQPFARPAASGTPAPARAPQSSGSKGTATNLFNFSNSAAPAQKPAPLASAQPAFTLASPMAPLYGSGY